MREGRQNDRMIDGVIGTAAPTAAATAYTRTHRFSKVDPTGTPGMCPKTSLEKANGT